jgi:hypothetical protein
MEAAERSEESSQSMSDRCDTTDVETSVGELNTPIAFP